MDWSMIGAVGEVLGAAAVVVSLVYLARQVSVSNRLARAEAWRGIWNHANLTNASWGTDPEFRRVFAQVLAGATREQLSEDDRLLVGFYLLNTTNTYDQLFHEVREGVLPHRVLDEFPGAPLFVTPYYKSAWGTLRAYVSDALKGHMEERFRLVAGGQSGDSADD